MGGKAGGGGVLHADRDLFDAKEQQKLQLEQTARDLESSKLTGTGFFFYCCM